MPKVYAPELRKEIKAELKKLGYKPKDVSITVSSLTRDWPAPAEVKLKVTIPHDRTDYSKVVLLGRSFLGKKDPVREDKLWKLEFVRRIKLEDGGSVHSSLVELFE